MFFFDEKTTKLSHGIQYNESQFHAKTAMPILLDVLTHSNYIMTQIKKSISVPCFDGLMTHAAIIGLTVNDSYLSSHC